MNLQTAKFIQFVNRYSQYIFVASNKNQTTMPSSVPTDLTTMPYRGEFDWIPTLCTPNADLLEPPHIIKENEIGVVLMSEQQLYELNEWDEVRIYYPEGMVIKLNLIEFWDSYEIVSL